MNRDIIFRAKTRYDHWVYGSLIIDAFGNHQIVAHKLGASGKSQSTDYYEVDPSTIGQLHNGLTRKAGSNVFVGDIIRHDLEAGLGQPKRIGLTETVRSVEFDFHYYSNVRLLGDKFDNPELTKQS